jgi:hypothetical protein
VIVERAGIVLVVIEIIGIAIVIVIVDVHGGVVVPLAEIIWMPLLRSAEYTALSCSSDTSISFRAT